jgi:putative transposase
MKKPYQIEAQRAVNRLEEMAAEGNPAVQMVLPMAEMVGWLRKGVGELVRQAGLQLMSLLMDEEVRELAGERSRPQPERTANRWGKERGYCVVMGQKVPIERPRVRTTEDKEVRLGSYEMFHHGEPLSGNRVGEANARSEHEEIRSSRARVHRSVRFGKERSE